MQTVPEKKITIAKIVDAIDVFRTATSIKEAAKETAPKKAIR